MPQLPDPLGETGVATDVSIAGDTIARLQGGYGVVVRSNQAEPDLANVIISCNASMGGLGVKSQLAAARSVLSCRVNTANTVSF
jgi:hypothetical protein